MLNLRHWSQAHCCPAGCCRWYPPMYPPYFWSESPRSQSRRHFRPPDSRRVLWYSSDNSHTGQNSSTRQFHRCCRQSTARIWPAMCHFRYRTTSHCRYLSTPPKAVTFIPTTIAAVSSPPISFFFMIDSSFFVKTIML